MKHEVEAVLLFVAELTGSYEAGTGTVVDKIECGKQDYIQNNLLNLDLNLEEDRKELHANIWLERLYRELDEYFNIGQGNPTSRFLAFDTNRYRSLFKWSVPVELDASASMLQYMGLLLNDKRLMTMTNIIGETLEDPWKLKGIPRFTLKKAATPMLYGSSKQPHELWQDAGISYTKEHLDLYNQEMKNGAFGVANLFKEFVLNNTNPKPEMEVNINGEEFSITCNRYRKVGEKTKAYKAWDTNDNKYNIVLHTDTKKVPDLKQFRRYFLTLLIHNLDSQVCDNVTRKLMNNYGWGIPIHDAILCSPAAARDVRKWYSLELKKIWKYRKQILNNYFNSIGITAAAQSQWIDLQAKIHQFEGTLEVNPMALK